jgi:hypothetical protein
MARFKKGESGNPKGRPMGSKHKVTLAALALLEGDLETITQVCVDKAKAGDLMAVKLILDKIIPNAKERPLSLQLPKIKSARDIPLALEAVMTAVSLGDINPGEGQALTTMLEAYRKGLEFTDIEARLRALEERSNAKQR